MERIIFLDIDGVMVTDFSAGNMADDFPNYFNPECVRNLNRVMDVTGAKIVVSSSWRKGDTGWLRSVFARNGISGQSIIGETPRKIVKLPSGLFLGQTRGREISSWISDWVKDNTNGNLHYVIIDDDSDFLPEQKPSHIQTNTYEGLTRPLAEKAIWLFNN